MKFVKGMVIGGTLAAAGMTMMYVESNTRVKRMVMKKGRQIAKRIGII